MRTQLVVGVGALVVGAIVAVALWRGSSSDDVTEEESPVLPTSWPVGQVTGRSFLVGQRPELLAFFEWWNRAGPFPIKVTSGYRSNAEQAELYAQGRTKPGAVVTNARTATDSPHGRRAACDAYPISNGKLVLDTTDPRWERYGAEAERFGLTWGGRWLGLRDYPHVEVTGWRGLPAIV